MYPANTFDKFTVTNKYLEQLDWNDKLAVVSSLERAQYFQSQRHFDFYSFTYPNQIYVYALKFLMRPNFPFANKLDRFIELRYIEMIIDPYRHFLMNKYVRIEHPSRRGISLGTVLRFDKCIVKKKKKVLARSFKKIQANSHIFARRSPLIRYRRPKTV